MTWWNAAIAVGSAIYQGTQADKQGDMAKKAMKDMNPFAPYRKQYAEMLGKLMDDPSSFLDNPLYHAAFDQGTQAVMRGLSSEGFLGSGNFATGLQTFGMGFANDFLQNQEKFLAHLAGADMGGQSGPLQSVDDSIVNTSNAMGQIGDVLGGFAGRTGGSGTPGPGAYVHGAGGMGPVLPSAPTVGP